MKWLLNIKDHLDFFRTEFKKNTDSWLLIIFASVIVLGVVSIILMSLSKTTIFPKDNERYDIDTIYVGQMKDFCPKEFDANPGKNNFEECASKLDVNKLIKVKIPTFKETLKIAPSLPYMMKQSSDTAIKKASEYFKEGNYFVVGIKVPEKYFSQDGGYIRDGKINDVLVDYNVLTFKAIRFGYVCVNRSCNNLLGLWSQNVIQIPLVKNVDDKNHMVWIFGLENSSPHGVWLDDGIMISKSVNLFSAYLFYSLFFYGKAMFASIAFVALFLVSIPFAIYLRRFFDYPAFSYFAGSTALWFISRNLFVVFPWLKGYTYRLVNIWIVLNFLLSILILNLAYARFKKVLKKRYFFIAHIIILSLVLFANFYFKDLGSMVAVWGRIELIFSNIATVVSLMPLAYGIYELTKMLRELKDPRPSTRLDYRRRIKELSIYAFIWLVFCSSYTYFAFIGLGTGNIGVFFSTSVGLTLLLLGVMLYYTHSKEITHMDSDSFAELDRLYRRKTTREFHELVKDPFEGVLLLIDLANSSGKDGRIKRRLMEDILYFCNKEANKLGYYANYTKPAGDDWKIIFMKKNSNLAEDLLEMTKFSTSIFYKLENIVKGVFEDSSIHISVFALSKYEVYINENQEAEYGYKSMIDFASSEVDLMLKYIEKSKVPNTIMVGGSDKFFSEGLRKLLLENHTNFLRDIVAEKNKETAQKLNLVYGLASL